MANVTSVARAGSMDGARTDKAMHKLEFKKYDPVARKHVTYKETKLK